jgi:hypothetical protein
MNKKNILVFGVAFVLTLISCWLAFENSYDFHQLAWTQYFIFVVWFGAAVWGLFISESRVPFGLGTLAAVVLGLIVPIVFHIYPWH